MSRQRATFGKLQRERDKQAKAKAKRERRLTGRDADSDPGPDAVRTDVSPVAGESAEATVALIAEVHRQFENAEISFEEYDERKSALLASLPVD